MSQANLSLRQAAWEVLNHFNAAKHNSAELIEKFGAKTQNRSALVDITLGIIRNSAFIDSLITQVSAQPKINIPVKTFNCLGIAVYELIFSSQPDYAIVSEAVELAGKTGSKKSAGFVNAVLRKICGHIKSRSVDLKTADPRKTLPLSSGIGCEFNIDILPDPAAGKAKYLSSAFSLPLWLIEQWLAQFGEEKTTDTCFASNRRPSVYARPNILKIAPDKLFGTLKTQDIDCDFIEKYKMVRLNKPGNIAELESFKTGLFTVQDITASLAVPLLNPQSGWKIFDICAAPGTKTTQIAELIPMALKNCALNSRLSEAGIMSYKSSDTLLKNTCGITSDKGLIIATDKDSARLSKLDENIRRLGITSVRIVDYETLLKDSSYKACGDAVLLDVPCSNSGVLARRPEVRLRITLKKINELAQIQKQLLNLAASLVKSSGRICYSTCSILNQENNGIVSDFLTKHSEFLLENENLILPSAGTCDFDGGYAALILKK